ncbi:MAG: LysR family transcriptional regulator [Methylocystis sp.]|jgi:DNA-binding transcriptional LysR family regulator|nr:LysR family transcriptional regulator [Methylocystis sp.]MCA3583050.1 LysR family transcriptional regulator [Methylocystis sp.]MCA3588124.1 LysR family transcriptional regulator [Methylocystis sp.]MCA3592510.1 LysR family transcriptional regulator [Methylocystis sp.]
MKQVEAAGLGGISWDDVSLIASIESSGSLRQAARKLGMNASTLIRHVERLEAGLGTTIFDRLPQGFVLNEPGKAIAEIGRDMQRHFLRLEEIAGQDSRSRGQVKIAITEGLGTFWVTPKLSEFAAENPEIVINLESSMDLRSPLRNEADIAIQFRKPENPDLIASRLCTLHVYPFASLRYIEKHGVPSADHKAAGHRIILQESEQISNDVVHEFLKRSRIEKNIAFITSSSIAHLCAIERGLGIGGLPTFAMAMGSRLVPVDIGLQHSIDVWISYRREMRKVQRVVIVLDWLRQIFNGQRYPWFSPAFMHPAEIMQTINQALDRHEYFDSRIIKNFFESKDDYMINQFKRPVGRPRKDRHA